jgi:hypothetical protein
MNRFFLALATGVCLSVAAAGCAGQLTTEEQVQLCAEHPGCLGGSGGSSGAGGSGGMVPMVDGCVTASMKSCSGIGCHSGTAPAVGLNLESKTLTQGYKAAFYDKSNPGTAGTTMPMDPFGCVPGAFKLIDPNNAMNSLIYMKLQTTPPCGSKMPSSTVVPFTDADGMCVLNWINSVIMASK